MRIRCYDVVPSAVDYYWVQNVSLNGDAYLSGSTYLYKDRDTDEGVSKLHWGPLWDFDYVAWGDLQYDGNSTEGFEFGSAPWAERLLANKTFAKAMYDRWPVLKGKLQELTAPGGMLDTWRQQLEVSRYYDVEKYGAYGDDWGWFLTDEPADAAARTYQQEVDQLRGWIDERIDWVDAHMAEIEPVPCTVEFYVDGSLVSSQESLVGRPLGEMPKAPAKDGATFVAWVYDDPDTGDESEADESYYVRVGTYKKVGDKTYYSAWSKAKKVRTK